MKSRLCIHVILSCLITVAQGSTIAKRQTPNCPPNCFQCDGGSCKSCNSGWYGQNCSKLCNYCSGGCYQDSGHCFLCPDERFGPKCRDRCPVNCRSVSKLNTTCNIVDGHCNIGCKDGFHGKRCNLTCDVNCTNRRCDQQTGSCERNCTRESDPECDAKCIDHCVKCTDSHTCDECQDGYHGPHCVMTRSSDHTTQSVYTSTTSNATLNLSQARGVSKAAVDTAVGVAFGIMVLLLLAFVVVYTNRQKWHRFYKKKEKEEPMFVQDAVGSPRLSRSYLKLHEVGMTSLDKEEEEQVNTETYKYM